MVRAEDLCTNCIGRSQTINNSVHERIHLRDERRRGRRLFSDTKSAFSSCLWHMRTGIARATQTAQTECRLNQNTMSVSETKLAKHRMAIVDVLLKGTCFFRVLFFIPSVHDLTGSEYRGDKVI